MSIVLVAVVLLMAAIGFEVGATAAIPRTDSFHQLGWSLAVIAGYAAATWLLSVVVKTLPLGITYATWAGLGTVAVAVIGCLAYGEQMSVLKVVAMTAIIGGVIVLNASSSHA
ncbi:SMR family transporter [Nocardioides sp. BP30]|uniref:DMT family transporter n=1 Tax=Nocardioides sp. BP30 TaxID=3036374 RepID=UPI002468D974|nr:SMR family transporter [Nocardioides sp. BP30]WGL53447.1 SMR family transporter [Nocardioides sp. BP30]